MSGRQRTAAIDDGGGRVANSNSFLGRAAVGADNHQPGRGYRRDRPDFQLPDPGQNAPSGFGANNLPPGLNLNPATGLISGVPDRRWHHECGDLRDQHGGSGNGSLTLQVQADADGDGMGDSWELTYGLNPRTAADALLDKDGDGQSNLAEWLAGTIPNQTGSRFGIASQQIIGSSFQLSWSSVNGRRYRVLTRPDFTDATWTSLTPTPIVATGTTTAFTHPGALNLGGNARFYRVEIVP